MSGGVISAPLFLLAIIATLGVAAESRGNDREAADVLRSKGLTRGGNLWRNPADVEFRKRLNGLDRAMT
ncbi:MAG: hypothetical protein N2C12_02555, partial [Planctomycetales bacterium]